MSRNEKFIGPAPKPRQEPYGPYLPQQRKPEQLVYITRGAEQLEKIARNYCLRVDDLVKANTHLCDPYRLNGGEAIIIPLYLADMREMNSFLLRNAFNDAEPRRRFGRLAPRSKVSGRLFQRCEPNQSGGANDLTADQLLKIVPQVGDKAASTAALINLALREAEITTRLGQAYFLSQVAIESAYFTKYEEDGKNSTKACPDGTRLPYFIYMYDKTSCVAKRRLKAAELGNTDEGDGARYHGRGMIQITGRNNYKAAGTALGVGLEANPDIATQPEMSARIAAWFWRHGNGDLNDYIGQDSDKNFRQITKRVNGAEEGPYTHRDRRLAIFNRAKQVFELK